MSEYVGYRVAQWREISGLTQAQLAEAVGVTQPLVSQIENGRRPVAKRALLIGLADALGVSVSDLLDQPRQPTSAEDLAVAAAVGAIRHALDGALAPEPLESIADAADQIITARARCDIATLTRLVPQVLAHTFDALDGTPEPVALDAAVKAAVFGTYAVKTAGYVDLAMRLAEHARAAARASGDPIHVAAAGMAICQALMASGSRVPALRTATARVADIEPHIGEGNAAAGWAVSLHLQAALCSASLGQHSDAASHLDAADDIARHAGPSPWHRDDVPTDAAIWRVTVALENGHAAEDAPDLAARIDRSKVRTPQRLARLYMDTGRGLYARNDHDGAVRVFTDAYDVAPSEVRNRGTVREVVGQMVRDAGVRGGSAPLRDLALKLDIRPLIEAA